MHTNQNQSPQEAGQESDKFYWHGYIPFYEKFFSNKEFSNIAEFGVFKGASIRWLLNRFPSAEIFGADILPYSDAWPSDQRFHFTNLDQADRAQIRNFLEKAKFDLIIEDGSHVPAHQVNCLVEGMRLLKNKGIYILEDIQTSLPHHPMHQGKKSLFRKQKLEFKGNALTVLLALDHYKRIGKAITPEIASKIQSGSLFSEDEVLELSQLIEATYLYRRDHLPDRCHNCGSADFDFSKFQCVCGQPIFSDTDSMSYVILKN